jgi:4-hydroxy-2-oxoheptanedioate aldolase
MLTGWRVSPGVVNSPIGHRSFPPFSFVSGPQICADIDLPLLQIPGVTDTTPEGETVFSLANKHVAIIPQIESRVGIKNLEEIMNMKEISAFMVGGRL